MNFCSGMPPGKVHELAFFCFGLPGPLLSKGCSRDLGQKSGAPQAQIQRRQIQTPNSPPSDHRFKLMHSGSTRHLRVVIFRRVSTVRKKKLPLPARGFREALQKNDTCFGLVSGKRKAHKLQFCQDTGRVSQGHPTVQGVSENLGYLITPFI